MQQSPMKPLIWWRYINDIWNHGEDSLKESVQSLNPTIKFTAEWSCESITFLDTRVFRRQTGLYMSRRHTPTNISLARVATLAIARHQYRSHKPYICAEFVLISINANLNYVTILSIVVSTLHL